MKLNMTVNGQERELDVSPTTRLLDVLRDDLRLTGAKEGCGKGECGACTVILNGELAASCLVLALQADGAEILTIEGLSSGEQLHPLQQAFIESGAVQCGFCTPGMILAAYKLLEEIPHPTEEEIRRGLSGNLCRCTGYQKIVDAVKRAAGELDPVCDNSGSRVIKTRGKESVRSGIYRSDISKDEGGIIGKGLKNGGNKPEINERNRAGINERSRTETKEESKIETNGCKNKIKEGSGDKISKGGGSSG